MAIIKVGDEYYTTTYHTDEGIFEDNISEDDIRDVIENGNLDYTKSGDEIYIKDAGKRRIAVVVVDGTTRIKTVYIVRKQK